MRAVERDVRRQGESTKQFYLFIQNEAELAGLKEQDEDSKTLLAFVHEMMPGCPTACGGEEWHPC